MVVIVTLHGLKVEFDGGEGWEGSQELACVAEVVKTQKAKAGEVRKLSEVNGRRPEFVRVELKGLQR